MQKSEILICVFSFNMGVTLDNCLKSLTHFCGDIATVLIDDNSTDPRTLEAIEKWRPSLLDVFVNRTPKVGQKHGNLYANIRQMCEYARSKGYRYLFMVQDDMQFVRPLDDQTLSQYGEIFASSPFLLQVDPRFVRRGKFEALTDIGAFKNMAPTSYADVGLLDLERLATSGWVISDGERYNRDGLAALGYRRVFPFTPIVAHVPFPQRYRNGKLKRSVFLRGRGRYGFHAMTREEMDKMDSRDIHEPPYFRTWLRVRGMYISRLAYWWTKDSSVLA